jgi:hypothetical protein
VISLSQSPLFFSWDVLKDVKGLKGKIVAGKKLQQCLLKKFVHLQRSEILKSLHFFKSNTNRF